MYYRKQRDVINKLGLKKNYALVFWLYLRTLLANIYLFIVNNRNTRKGCEICSKFTIKTLERRQLRHSSVFMVNFEYISHLFLVFLFLILNNVSWITRTTIDPWEILHPLFSAFFNFFIYLLECLVNYQILNFPSN